MARQLLKYGISANFLQSVQFGVGRSVRTFTQNGWKKTLQVSSEPISSVRAICTSCGNGGGILYSSSSYRGSDELAAYPVSKSLEFPSGKRFDNPISQRLVSAKTTEEILSIFETDAEQMDTLILSVAVDALFDCLKNETEISKKAKHQLLTSVGMQKLCKQLRRRSPHMDPGDIINCVKLLSVLNAPGSHQTFQILLKLLSKHANLMDLQQLIYTQFLLDKLDPESKSPLSKALEYALPVVVESKLQTDLDFTDGQAICDYLHYASRYKLPEKIINLLVESALRLSDRLTVQSAKSILWSLCDTKCENMSHEPLVTWCFDKLTGALNDMSLLEITTTMGKVARKYHGKKAPYFYHEPYVNACCQKLSEPGTNALDALWAIKNVSAFRHLNIDYLDRVGEIIAANPSYILNNDHLFEVIVKSLSNLNYKPEKWSSFSSIILEHPALTKAFTVYDVPLTIDFLSLDLFPDYMLRTLFSADGLVVLEEFREKYHPINLVILYNAVKVLCPQYRGPLPPHTMIENWKELARAANRNKQYPLKAALQTGLGGESYVINGLYHDGLHIDHGIVMRKGGYPVAVNSQVDSQSDCLSSISKPAESVIVLVKVFSKELYANNTKRLRGLAALEQKIVDNLGHPVVSVDLEQWMELPDHEKIPYLMQRIREKMEPMQWNQNWGDVIPP